jgi:hypothetical protein
MMRSMERVESGKTAEAISGRATGVLFFAVFGSLWLYNGMAAMHRLTPVSMAAIVAICAALAIPAAMLLRSASRAAHASGAGTLDSPEVKRAFFRVNLMQWAAIVTAAVLFNAIHKQEFLAPVITFIVGAHLIPLARLFLYAAHYVTGTLLMAWATVIAIAFPAAMMPTVGAWGTAAILLGSAVYTLASAGRAAKLSLTTSSLHVAGA